MENPILDYSHAIDWSESQVDAMKAWLSTTWVTLEGDEPDQDFLEYIMVMIKTQKKMHELQAELKDLGVDEEKARKFAIGIGEKLQEFVIGSPREKKAESKVISVVSTATQEKKTMGPLKSSRGSSVVNPNSNVPSSANPVNVTNAGSSRLLQSALSSSRTVSNGNNNNRDSNGQQRQQQGGNNNDSNTRRGQGNNQGNNHGQKRGQDNFNDRPDRDGKRQNFNQDRNNHGHNNNVQVQRTVSMSALQNSNLVTKNAPPAVGSVEYFQEMNKVAQASGFKNAQEMLASQKEMMSLMQGAPAPVAVMAGPPVATFAPPVPMYPYPQQGFPMQPPYPGGAPPPPQGQPFFAGRGYAGRGGGRWEAGYTGRGGRGRGRGAGRGAPGAEGAAVVEGAEAVAAPAEGSAPAETPSKAAVAGPAIYAEMEQEAAAKSAASGYAGRGGGRGRGRGYQGRGDWSAAPPQQFQQQAYQQQAYPAYPAAPFAAQPYAGRGYQGRGYQGRGGRGFVPQPAVAGAEGATEGAAAPQHKVWVRKPDLATALVTGR